MFVKAEAREKEMEFLSSYQDEGDAFDPAALVQEDEAGEREEGIFF